MTNTNDLILLNQLLAPITERLLKGEKLEDLAKSEEFKELIEELNLTDSRVDESIEKAGFKPKAPSQGKSKAGLTYVQKQVTKEGRTFTQGFWIKTNDTSHAKQPNPKAVNREERRTKNRDTAGAKRKAQQKENHVQAHKGDMQQKKENKKRKDNNDGKKKKHGQIAHTRVTIDDKGKASKKELIGDTAFEGTKQAHTKPLETEGKDLNDKADIKEIAKQAKQIKVGNYSPQRTQLHSKIIQKKLNECPKPKAGEKPKCILLGGGSASGKSCSLKMMGDKVKEYGTVDCDALMSELPEYKSLQQTSGDICANMAHYEASDLATASIDAIVSEGRNFIYDGTCAKPDKYKKIIKQLREQGYEIELLNVTCDFEEAYKRNVKRSVEEGREVPFAMVKSTHEGNAGGYDEIKALVDKYTLYDNNPDNVDKYGEGVIVVETEKGVNHKEAKERFDKKKKISLTEADLKGDKQKHIDEKHGELAEKEAKNKKDRAQKQQEATRTSGAWKEAKRENYKRERKERLKNKALKNVGKSEPMMSLAEFWKSMDNPMSEEEIYKSVSGEDKVFVPSKEDFSFLESKGIDRDDCFMNRPHPKHDEIMQQIKGGKSEESEEKEE